MVIFTNQIEERDNNQSSLRWERPQPQPLCPSGQIAGQFTKFHFWGPIHLPSLFNAEQRVVHKLQRLISWN